jgi:beta-N-acetylhexosaminidase
VRTRQRALFVLFLAPLLSTAATVRREPAVSPTVTRWMKSLSLREKVAQLVVIPFSGFASQSRTPEHRKFIHLIRDVRVGGLILVNIERGRLVQRPDPTPSCLSQPAAKMARLPLWSQAIFQRGASMRINVTVFPTPWRLPPPAIGSHAPRTSGCPGIPRSRVHWLPPDADAATTPTIDHQYTLVRRESDTVAAHAVAFVEGANQSRRQGSHHGEAFSRTRRHRHRYSPRPRDCQRR